MFKKRERKDDEMYFSEKLDDSESDMLSQISDYAEVKYYKDEFDPDGANAAHGIDIVETQGRNTDYFA